eukprot:TRINITY_DN59127_c0_g1_i1.p1 TRINITY_DN59127_c0_g1~~TRINITY_DN59127_c0_g1_i1.p1  ORF type:complete len:1329 (+),score=325.24 TRINITY_DN59127_c0_g1_i1:66-3989(+)
MAGHPWDRVSCFNRFFLLWLWPLLLRGSQKPLTEEDIYELPEHLQATALDRQWYQTLLQRRTSKSKVSVLRVLMGTYGWRYPVVIVVFAFWLGSLSCIPVLTDRLFRWLESDEPLSKGLTLVAILVGCYLVNCNSTCQWYQQTTQLGCELRNSASMMVFRRALGLSACDVSKDNAVNLVQVDSERLFIFAQLNHMIYVAVMVTIMVAGYLIDYEGLVIAAVATFAVVAVVILQGLLTRVASGHRRRMQQMGDQRIALLSEILGAVRLLKMHNWEEAMLEKLRLLRRVELVHALAYLAIRAFSSALLYCSPTFTMLAVIAVLRSRDEEITPERIFLLYTIVGLARAPLAGGGIGSAAMVDGFSAFRRLNNFVSLAGPDADFYDHDLLDGDEAAKAAPKSEQQALQLSGSFVHRSEPLAPGHAAEASFRVEADFNTQAGDFVAITGSVAAGKSSVLLAALGEMTKDDEGVPQLRRPDHVAYLAQKPWLRSGSIRENIIQDLPDVVEHYHRAIRAAQLLPDFKLFAGGDNTYVGAKGVTLSGGQCARVGLAHILYRCLVSRVDTVLLDDFLAAMDVHVARAVAEEGLLGIILDGKRCVMMVMNSNFVALRSATKVLNVEGGLCTLFQSPEAWLNASPASARSAVEHTVADISAKHSEEPVTIPRGDLQDRERQEEVRQGSLGSRVLGYYFGAGDVCLGRCIAFGATFIILGAELVRIIADYLMGQWADLDASNADSSEGAFQLFVGWALFSVCAAFFRAFVSVCIACRASHRLHERLLTRVMNAPIGYFDTMPTGRILAYFSKDLEALDALLPQFGLDFVQDITLLLGVVGVVVWSTPMATIAVVPVLLVFYQVRGFFSRTARETKRIDGMLRGDVCAVVNEVQDGLVTLRAHGQRGSMLDSFRRALDRNSKAFFQTGILQPWCILVLDTLGALIVLTAATSVVLLRESVPTNVALMAITYSMMTRGKLQFCIRLSIEAENQLVAAERLQIFEASLPQEEQSAAAESMEAEAWPSAGAVSFRAVKMRYSPELPLVLRGLDLEVVPGTKVGIAGRTGSGKSSLLRALLRLTELDDGVICIDGVDIRGLPLRLLRSAISVIPQDPVMWSGSVAFNVDPTGHSARNAISTALDKVGLGSGTAMALQGGADGIVEAHGGNLSAGQRQLLCIARCIVRQSRIVLIDEATSSVDGETDSRVQEALRSSLVGSTQLVVAHRIQTLLDADQIVVMEAGLVIETGSPTALQQQQQPASAFAGLLAAASSSVAKAPSEDDDMPAGNQCAAEPHDELVDGVPDAFALARPRDGEDAREIAL